MYISGLHSIEEYLKHPTRGGELYVSGTGKRVGAIIQTAHRKHIKTVHFSHEEIVRITGINDHKGVVLSLPSEDREIDTSLESFLASLRSESALVILLDGITDPQNLGAILRSADQFGADCVILPKRRSAVLNDTVLRVSSGAADYVLTPVVPNITRALELLKKAGFWIYGADAGGEAVGSIDLRGRTAVVLGNEGAGLSRLVKDNCDGIVSIPTAGHIDSLNVSVAAGILMYEIRRQQDS